MDRNPIQLSPADRDLTIRTILGEARNQGDAGQAAVAHVILNRVAHGGYGGKNASDVVLANKKGTWQFEPWGSRRDELLSYSPQDKAYQRAGAILDQALTGDIPDFTDGATNFLNRRTVQARGTYKNPNGLPNWAQGEGQDIGDHTFYKPNGPVRRAAAPPAAEKPAAGADVFGRLDALADGPAKAQPATAAQAAPAATQKPAGDVFATLDALAPKDAPKAAVEPGTEAAAVGAGLMNGVPIVGPYILGGAQRVAAGLRTLQSGKPFAEELQTVRDFTAATQKENPGSTTTGEILGGVAGLAPVAATGVGAGALGLTGNMLTRIAAGGASGGVIGVADAAVRAEDAAQGGAMGLGLGAAAPVVGKAIGAAAGPVVNRLTTAVGDAFSGSTRANNALLQAIEGSGMDTAALRAELARNPNLALADLSPALREQLTGLAQGGPQAAQVQNWVNARRGAQGEQMRASIDATIGAAADPVALRELMSTVAASNARRGFSEALKGAKPVDLAGLPESSINKIQEAWDRVLSAFPDKTQMRFSQPEQLHLVQQQLRKEADTLAKSSVGTERLAANDIRNVRSQLVDRIDQAAGGKFKPAQKQFADDMQIREAFDNGMSALGRVQNGAKGLDARPETLRAEWKGMSEAEREAFRQGMRTQIQTTIENARNPARAGEAVTDPGFNREKLAIVFGDKETKALLAAVEDSRRIADTNNRIFAGSDTAQRTAARESVRVRGESAPAGGVELPALAGVIGGPEAAGISFAAKAFNSTVGRFGTKTDLTRNQILANDLTRSGSEGAEVLNRLDAFLASRANPQGARAIADNRPLNLLIRSGGAQLLPVP